MNLMEAKAVVETLYRWVEATNPYCEPRDANIEEEVRLVERTKALSMALKAMPYDLLKEEDSWNAWFTIHRNMLNLSGQFLWGDYTDSNTDEPCDVEWDVHTLLSKLVKDYQIPDEVRPAYVGNYYDGPKGDQE